MLVKLGIIPLFFATFALFCSTSESPLNGCGVDMEERIEQKAAKGVRTALTDFDTLLRGSSRGTDGEFIKAVISVRHQPLEATRRVSGG